MAAAFGATGRQQQQQQQAAADAAGEVAILLDSLDALVQHSIALEAARPSKPGGALLAGSGAAQDQGRAECCGPGQEEGAAEVAACERGTELEATGLSGGLRAEEEEPDKQEVGSKGDAGDAAANRVAEGLQWGFAALRALVSSGAACTIGIPCMLRCQSVATGPNYMKFLC